MKLSKQQRIARSLQTAVTVVTADAIKRFEVISPVQRVVLKINPSVVGEFVFMAILQNEQRYEGRKVLGERQAQWCMKPNCNCLGFVRLSSPYEAGMTIDD